MHLNTDPLTPPRKPCWRDMALLIDANGPLPAVLVQSMSLKQLRRRIQEINVTHPQFQEEAPLVLVQEQRRRRRLGGGLVVSSTSHVKVA